MKTKIARHICSLAFAITFLCTATTSQAAATYVWVSGDANSYGLQGTIVFSMPAYSGTAFNPSMILSVTMSDNVGGSYIANLPTDLYGWGTGAEWGPAGITTMTIGLVQNPTRNWYFNAGSYAPPGISRQDNGGQYYYPDYVGSWVAVPEPGSMSICLFAMALGIVRRMTRR